MDLEKLLEKEKLCITDYPSACTATCPIHVDARAFIAEMQAGNFKKAYTILSKRMPFPTIIGRICDHPCENACVRKSLGGAIAISELEKIVVQVGSNASRKKTYPIPKKDKHIAVVGGGISGVTAAFDLSKKGYLVTIYEAKGRLGGRMWDFSEDQLPQEVITEGLSILDELGIKIKLNTVVGKDITLDKLSEEYDAVYLGTGEWSETITIDPITFETGMKGIFSGGRLMKENNQSIIYSVSTGRRAALSIDRYVQGASLTSVRENEGSYETPLEVNLHNIESKNRIPMSNKLGYTEEEAIEEAQRCIQCQCIECVKACTHMQKFKVNPKTYIRQINQNERIVLGSHYPNKMINSCTLCGLCEAVCPTKLDMGAIVKEERESMVIKDKMPPSAHDFALRDMAFNNSKYFKLLKHQPGKEESKYLFFPGCQLSASAPEYVEKVYSYLMEKITDGVGLMLGCCGAPADWAGRQEMFKEIIQELTKDWESMGKPKIILACSTCYNIFKKHFPEDRIVSLWEFMLESGLPCEKNMGGKMTLAIHDACTTRHEPNVQNSVRKIIDKLGYKIEELEYSKEKTQCCGYGGLVYFANREMTEDIIEARIHESEKDYVSYCFMCRDLFAWKGKRTLHILDLIYGQDINELALKKGPTLSERHANRTHLKKKLLKNLWGEEMSEITENNKLNIVLSEEMVNKMEDRLILVEDLEKVLDYAENTKSKFIDSDNGHYIAHRKLGHVTYWVEYEVEGDQYIIHNTYSHRMEIMEE
jgi:glutamate synthase (NADPH/NADH) small chain